MRIHPGLGIFMIGALMITALTSIMGVTAIVSSDAVNLFDDSFPGSKPPGHADFGRGFTLFDEPAEGDGHIQTWISSEFCCFFGTGFFSDHGSHHFSGIL